MNTRSVTLERTLEVGDLLLEISQRLRTDSAGLDAQVLLAHVLNKPKSWIAAYPEARLTPSELDSVEKAVARLEGGEPLPYVIGHWEFFGFDFHLTPEVLIPRPETELLVEKAIAFLQASPTHRTVADVGTGSGAIGISIARHIPDAQIIATDISAAALDVAKQNAGNLRVAERMEFIHCDLLPPSSDLRFDLICANLPYIPTETLLSLPVYGREPTLALDGGTDGLDLIRRLLIQAAERLAPNGLILLEIEATQGSMATSLARDIYPLARIILGQDPAGHDRLLEIAP